MVESIRAGLAFALKEAVGGNEIRRREHDLGRRALRSWAANPRIDILGNTHVDRLAVISLRLRHPPGHLHARFVAAVLSDLFGIQARSGCFCAGPYIHRATRSTRTGRGACTPKPSTVTSAPSSRSRG